VGPSGAAASFLCALFQAPAGLAVVQEFDAGAFQHAHHTAQRIRPGADWSIEILHPPNRAKPYFRALRQRCLRPPKEAAGCPNRGPIRIDDFLRGRAITRADISKISG